MSEALSTSALLILSSYPSGTVCGRSCSSPETTTHSPCPWWPLWRCSTPWSICFLLSHCCPPAWRRQSRWVSRRLLALPPLFWHCPGEGSMPKEVVNQSWSWIPCHNLFVHKIWTDLVGKPRLFRLFLFLNFFFCIGVELINSVMMISGEQRRDSDIHIHGSTIYSFYLSQLMSGIICYWLPHCK